MNTTACKRKCQQQHSKERNISMCNTDVREYAKAKNVRLWQVAMKLHINDGNLSRRLRVELPADKKAEIFKIIDGLAEEREG